MDQTDKDRIDGRLWAEEILGTVKDVSMAFEEGFWRRIINETLKKKKSKPTKIVSSAMTDEEARAFGKQVVNFGKHRGKKIDDVPLNYWEWLADENREVQRYLRSKRIQKESDAR